MSKSNISTRTSMPVLVGIVSSVSRLPAKNRQNSKHSCIETQQCTVSNLTMRKTRLCLLWLRLLAPCWICLQEGRLHAMQGVSGVIICEGEQLHAHAMLLLCPCPASQILWHLHQKGSPCSCIQCKPIQKLHRYPSASTGNLLDR
jgi:hypothetical protein